MIGGSDLPNGFDKFGPARAAIAENLASCGCQAIEALAALARGMVLGADDDWSLNDRQTRAEARYLFQETPAW